MADDLEERSDESEEENVKDRWDDDSGESDEEKLKVSTEVPKKKSKTLKDKIADKEKQEEEKKKAETNNLPVQSEPTSGVAHTITPGLKDSIDNYEPSTREEFDRLKDLITQRVTKFDRSPLYVGFLDELLKTLCKDVDIEEIKKVSNTLLAVSNEKSKQSKATKTKKKTKKANLAAGKDIDMADQYGVVADDVYDEFEDYL